MAVVVTVPVPFFDIFLDKLTTLNYPKDHLHLFIYNNVPFHHNMTQDFLKKWEKKYKSTKIVVPMDHLEESRGRQLAV